jgi:hypothetical protein
MGQPVETPKATAAHYRILVNGQPLAAPGHVSWETFSQSNKRNSGTSEVGSDGTIAIERRYFTAGADSTASVVLSGSYLSGASEFEQKIPGSVDFDSTKTINVQTFPLEIEIHGSENLNAPYEGKVEFEMVRLQPNQRNELPDRPWMEFDEIDQIVADPTIRLPSVQAGTYGIWIAHAGSEIWKGIVEVGLGMRPIKATLRPGSDVRYTITSPAGTFPGGGGLYRNGIAMKIEPAYRDRVYQFLPVGDYVLNIPGTEIIEEYERTQNVRRGPDEVSWKGRKVAFRIEKGSPAVIDLGDIKLEPVHH